jgi:hypothetical protein
MTQALQQELIALLATRRSPAANWERLWELIQLTLGRLRPGILKNLRETPADLLQGFVVEKLIEKDYCFDHYGTLVTAWTNYLTDIYRRNTHRPLADDLMPESDEEDAPSFVDRVPGEENVEANVGTRKFLHAAGTFFDQLEEDGKRYLGHSLCDEDGPALSALAKRHKLVNYHKRARSLGIVQNQQALVRDDYAQTRIGRWLTQTLGLRLIDENIDEIRQALKALCERALVWAMAEG